MKTYHGSCHCEKVRFELRTTLEKVIICNCSICTKKGAIHHRVPKEQFRLLTGTEELTLYNFNTKKAKHYFCKHCGIHPFSNPRLDPTAYSVNIRCLDDFDLEASTLEIIEFDGKNWEKAAKGLK